MRIAAIYDIHGNLPALDAVLQEINRESSDLIVVGGDIVSGPLPRATMERLMGLGIGRDSSVATPIAGWSPVSTENRSIQACPNIMCSRRPLLPRRSRPSSTRLSNVLAPNLDRRRMTCTDTR